VSPSRSRHFHVPVASDFFQSLLTFTANRIKMKITIVFASLATFTTAVPVELSSRSPQGRELGHLIGSLGDLAGHTIGSVISLSLTIASDLGSGLIGGAAGFVNGATKGILGSLGSLLPFRALDEPNLTGGQIYASQLYGTPVSVASS
jgi:hypothetical protein